MSCAAALEQFSVPSIPSASGLRHLAIIMDGNRRWASLRHLPPIVGHQQGVEALRRTALYANALGLPILTVYAFSTENWLRPAVEVSGLMELFISSLRQMLQELHENGIRLQFFGKLTHLSTPLQAQIEQAMALTSENPGMTLQVAMNYGGRQELVQACVALIKKYQAGGGSPDELKEEDISAHLYNPGCPAPDAILRTGGEQRLSNFLLWQAAYSEIMLTDVLWPDFSPSDIDRIVTEFANRKRRFGR